MKTTFLVAAIAAGITLAATAQAREGYGDRGARLQMPTFEEIDANGDGNVTPEEIATAMQVRADARFAQVDTNGDGALSADELSAQVDADRAERMADRIAKRIEDADANGDGLLQAEELAAQMEDRMEGRRGGADRLFDRFDADENGSLSAEEFADAAERMQGRGDRGRGDN